MPEKADLRLYIERYKGRHEARLGTRRSALGEPGFGVRRFGARCRNQWMVNPSPI
jgi:hypothetical protein